MTLFFIAPDLWSCWMNTDSYELAHKSAIEVYNTLSYIYQLSKYVRKYMLYQPWWPHWCRQCVLANPNHFLSADSFIIDDINDWEQEVIGTSQDALPTVRPSGLVLYQRSENGTWSVNNPHLIFERYIDIYIPKSRSNAAFNSEKVRIHVCWYYYYIKL